jgi:alpha-D-ribose 1-methylphosphonate 5-triphosphate synthase subunit PhnH
VRAEIRSGHARPERKLAVCSGGISLSPEDRAELLAVLAADADASIAERARSVLITLPKESFLTALGRPDADAHLFKYCAEQIGEKPGIADALARNEACPAALVTSVARHLTASGIQALLDNMERLSSDDHLATALAQSQGATAEQQALLAEIHKNEPISEKDLEDAAKQAEPDPVKRETLLKQVAHMNVVQRLTLALKGNREARMILIKDPNKLVQRCVLQSPRLTDMEVEAFAKMTNLSDEVFRVISLTRKFMKSYVIMKNLVNNPKTPLDISLHLLPRLNANDLKLLTANKNIPDTLRSIAVKMQRQRTISALKS